MFLKKYSGNKIKIWRKGLAVCLFIFTLSLARPVNSSETSTEVLPENAKVRLQGFALSLPGQFGQQFFYLYHNKKVIQIYNYWKKFPNFKINDYLEVTALTGASSKIIRFKTKEADDVKIIDKNSLVSPLPLASPPDLNIWNLPGPTFITLKGEISQVKPTTFILSCSEKEVTVDPKNLASFNLNNFKVNDRLEISGLLFNKASTFKLYPRIIADIKKVSLIVKPVNSSGSESIIPVTNETKSRLDVQTPGTLGKYFGLFLTCALIFIIIRKH